MSCRKCFAPFKAPQDLSNRSIATQFLSFKTQGQVFRIYGAYLAIRTGLILINHAGKENTGRHELAYDDWSMRQFITYLKHCL